MAQNRHSNEHLAIFDAMAKEFDQLLVEFNWRVNQTHDTSDLIGINRERLSRLREMIHRHGRSLDFMEGKPIEPEVHFGEAVLPGKAGLAG